MRILAADVEMNAHALRSNSKSAEKVMKAGLRPVVCVLATAFTLLWSGLAKGEQPLSACTVDEEPGGTRFESYCAACHQQGGIGIEGRVPPLTGSPWVAGPESRLIRIVLHGLRGPIKIQGKTYNLEMPGFHLLTDQEIASLLSFVRRHYGRPSPPISAATVSQVRAATRNRTGYWTVDKLLDVP